MTTPTKRDEMPEEIWAWNNPDCGLRCYSQQQRGDTKYRRADLPAPADGELREAYAAIRDLAAYCEAALKWFPYATKGSCKLALEKHAAAIQKSQDSK